MTDEREREREREMKYYSATGNGASSLELASLPLLFCSFDLLLLFCACIGIVHC
jgi:hypothetical protein